MIYFLISLFIIDNMSVSVKRSNFTLVFSKTAWNVNSGEVRKTSSINFVYFKTSFSKRFKYLTITYRFQQVKHKILLNLLF